MKIQKISLLLLATCVTYSSLANTTELERRIAPFGKVYLAEDLEGYATEIELSAAVEREPYTGATLYKAKCSVCHDNGVTDAPIPGKANQWDSRIAQGLPTLVSHAINGYNLMPAKGTCLDCTDLEIENAVRHMIGENEI